MLSTRRSFVLVPGVLAAACSRRDKFDYGQPKNRYPLQGEITGLRAEDRIATVRHQKIEGWMEAMTMDFPVPSAAEFGKLKVGAKIRATVNVNDEGYWLTAVQVE
jgi:protein SCO1/2